MRLIDADALKKALANMWYDSPVSVTGISVSELIDSQPTIEPSDGDLISRQDAIEAVMAEGRNVYTSEYANAERIIYEADAVEVLSLLPSARPTHKPDYTYEAEMVQRLQKLMADARPIVIRNETFMPTAEVVSARPTGEWIEEITGNGWNEWMNLTCNQCGSKFKKAGAWLYCPMCGAKMGGTE